MITKRRVLFLLGLPLLLACSLLTSLLPSGTRTSTAAPQTLAAVTLPATYTPTGPPPPSPTLPATPSREEDLAGQAAALQPRFVVDVETYPDLTRYFIRVTIEMAADGRQAVLAGEARILFTNPLDDRLEDLVLMLCPNDPQSDADMTAGPLLVDGRIVEPRLTTDGIALRAALPRSLAPGEQVDVSLPFRVEIDRPMLPSQPKRLGLTEGVLLAPTFYPLVPRLVEGEWQVEPAPPGGDTTNSDVAYYDVVITWPADLQLAASGAQVNEARLRAGAQAARFVTGPMRDFALAVGPFALEERRVDGITLRAWLLPEHAAVARQILTAVEVQLQTLSQAVGPYPYTELDIVDAPGTFAGIEYPGLVFIGALGTHWVIEPVVHEIGHQWFYGLIGNDQLESPWLDEAAASYTEVLYYEAAIGPERGTTALSEFRQQVETFAQDPQTPIGLPVADYSSESEYGLIVYAKGALFFDALRREIGDEVFFAFLQRYFEEYRYGFALPANFERQAEAACGCNLNALFDLWVYKGGPLPGP
jgi:hypothetical protein